MKDKQGLSLAILGCRGVPARYSGFDTLAQELSYGLAKLADVEIVVYCRSPYYKEQPRMLNSVRLVYLPAPRVKAVESLLHSFLSSLHVLWLGPQCVYFVDPGNAPFCVFLRLCGKKVVVHTDGLGWKRLKWGWAARKYYKWVEWLCARTANALVTDNPEMQTYYESEYRARSTYIPYGASNDEGLDDSVYSKFSLRRKSYVLVVARFEPENNTTFIVAEYSRSNISMPLVVVGDSPYDPLYMTELRRLANDRVIFTGRIDDQAKLNALYDGAVAYLHGHEVGGTNPSLLRAMDASVPPIVIDVPFNRAVIADCGFRFSKEPGCLAHLLETILRDENELSRIGRMAKSRAATAFTWESVVAAHYHLFRQVAGISRATDGRAHSR